MKIKASSLATALFLLWMPVMAAALILIFKIAPEDSSQGIIQKIFYFHVSSAVAMNFSFLASALGALLYLITRKKNYDAHARAGAVLGLMFCTMVLVSGPLWAKPIWGTWWTWDPRLTTTFLLWLIFISILFLRKYVGDNEKGRVFASVLTLFGALDVPLVFISVKLWRGIHPSVLGQEGSMPQIMKTTLYVSMAALILLWATLQVILAKIYKLEGKEDFLKD